MPFTQRTLFSTAAVSSLEITGLEGSWPDLAGLLFRPYVTEYQKRLRWDEPLIAEFQGLIHGQEKKSIFFVSSLPVISEGFPRERHLYGNYVFVSHWGNPHFFCCRWISRQESSPQGLSCAFHSPRKVEIFLSFNGQIAVLQTALCLPSPIGLVGVKCLTRIQENSLRWGDAEGVLALFAPLMSGFFKKIPLRFLGNVVPKHFTLSRI